MLPTSTLPISPLAASSAGLLLGVLAVGGLVALVAGYLLHRREQRLATRVDVLGPAEVDPQRRLSA